MGRGLLAGEEEYYPRKGGVESLVDHADTQTLLRITPARGFESWRSSRWVIHSICITPARGFESIEPNDPVGTP